MTFSASIVEPDGTQLDYYVCQHDRHHRLAYSRKAAFWFFTKRETLLDNAAERAFSRALASRDVVAQRLSGGNAATSGDSDSKETTTLTK
jgi:hypothetical protein